MSEDLKVGPEMDVVVAERLLGWVWRPVNKISAELIMPNGQPCVLRDRKKLIFYGYSPARYLPSFTESVDAVMPIWQKYKLIVLQHENGRWFAGYPNFGNSPISCWKEEDGGIVVDQEFEVVGWGDTAAEAICRCGLKIEDQKGSN